MTGPESALWNPDLAPTTAADRNWAWYHFAALWVGMIVAVPSWMLAAGLIEQGMSAVAAATTVLLGNAIILIPLLLIGHAGARHGVPFPILARASFGTSGAKVPAVARALVAAAGTASRRGSAGRRCSACSASSSSRICGGRRCR